jgi:glyoxylase-like metal-dependent hydrolase (beta-lactamase superfamily II)
MQIGDHLWWMPPAKPDRPSLCAVVGERWTLLLDAGASRAHTRSFLDELPTPPSAVVYTHSHWDHVFGGVEAGGLVIAQRQTAANLMEMAGLDWNDDRAPYVNDDIREELPAPRTVEIAQADIVFDDSVEFDLGGVTVRVEHVVSDHCDDACVAVVQPDRLLFVGDALCAGRGVMTEEKAFPLFDRILAYHVDRYVEGHHEAVTSRAEMAELVAKARAAAAGTAPDGDEDARYFLEAFLH